MADKYNKLEPKIPKEVIISLSIFLVVVVALFFIIRPSNQDKVYTAFSGAESVSADFTEDHPFYEVNYKQLVRHIENDEIVFVFIGTPDNAAAAAYVGAYQKYYESEGASEYADYIYYYNPVDDDDNFLELRETFEGDVTTSQNQLLLFINGEVSTVFVSGGTTSEQVINRAARDFFEDAVLAIEDAN